MGTVECRAALATQEDPQEAQDALAQGLGVGPWDLLFVAATPEYGPAWEEFMAGLHARFAPGHLIGCSAAGVIGPQAEREEGPAVAAWGARLPGAKIQSFFLDEADLEACSSPDELGARLGVSAQTEKPAFLLIPDPYTFDADRFLTALDGAYPGACAAGGMASAAHGPGQSRLFSGEQVFSEGAVGLAITGGVAARPVVSQGCRPVGKPFVVTRSRQNVIDELGGKPALAALQETFDTASDADKALMRRGLHIGRVVDETLRSFKPGDFLVRNLMGVTEESGIAVGEPIRPGRTVQFHVRDAKTASDEIKTLVAAEMQSAGRKPAGGLLFNCNGRGQRLFGVPDHDIGVIAGAAGCPVAGFFAAGEIGPVGNRTFVHGFTSSMMFFYNA